MLPDAPAPIEMTLVGVRRRVRTAQGLTVPVLPAITMPRPDVVLVPALGAKMPQALAARLVRPDVRDAAAVLQRWARGGAMAGAACTGTFVLAESTLLDGHHATTSWWLAPMFRQRYPKVALDESRMLVNSAGLTTAGAAMAHLDLALSVVRSRSPALAALAARYLLVEARGSQAEYAIPDHLAHAGSGGRTLRRLGATPSSLAASPSPTRRAPPVPASARWRGACATCWARHRCRTSRTCASSAPFICCEPAMRASTRSRRRSAMPTA